MMSCSGRKLHLQATGGEVASLVLCQLGVILLCHNGNVQAVFEQEYSTLNYERISPFQNLHRSYDTVDQMYIKWAVDNV